MVPERFQIKHRLGRGGIGEVFLAHDSSTNTAVAVKVISLKTLDADVIKKEVAALALLDHKYVVHFVDSFEHDGSMYIITEYVDGSRLFDYIQAGPLDAGSIQKYGTQILEALDYIHSRGIIHSDLKPQNILIDAEENVKLIDFGIARSASPEIATDIKEIRGTLHYMSPEQAEGYPYDIRSDLFAFGIILYELYTGRKPFSGEHDMAIIYSILYEDPVPPDKVSPQIPPQVSAVIMRLLAKSPADRPGSAKEAMRLIRQAWTGGWGDIRPHRIRLAILPFASPDDDREGRLLAGGLKDEFYSSLLGIEDLDIVSPVTIESCLPNLKNGPSIRAALGADYYLRGSIRRTPDRVRIYFTLHASGDDTVIWTDKFDSPMGSLFDLIDAISETVLIELKVRLFSKNTTAKAATTANPEAYELYLLARSYYIKNTKKDIEYAREIFTQALQVDPHYSLAYVGLADCHCVEYMNYYDRGEGNVSSAIAEAERALSLTPHLPEAYRALGRIMQVIGKHEESRLYYLKAVTYNGEYYQAYRSLGWLAVETYTYNDAIAWVRKALSIKSTDIETILLKGLIHLDRKESILAINDFTRCLELRPDYGRACFFMGMAYFRLGRTEQAIRLLERARELGGDINAPYLLGYYYLAAGDLPKARKTLNQAAKFPEIAFLAEFFLGLLETLHGDQRRAARRFQTSSRLCRQLLEADPTFILAKSTLCKNLAYLGQRDCCLDVTNELRHYAAFDGSFALELAHIHAILGNKNEAREYIERAIAIVRGPSSEETAIDPLLKHCLQ